MISLHLLRIVKFASIKIDVNSIQLLNTCIFARFKIWNTSHFERENLEDLYTASLQKMKALLFRGLKISFKFGDFKY